MVHKEGIEKVITGEFDKFIYNEKKGLVNKMQRLVTGYFRMYLPQCVEDYIIPIDVCNTIAQFTSADRIDTSFFKERINLYQIQIEELDKLLNDMQTQQVNIQCECEILRDRI